MRQTGGKHKTTYSRFEIKVNDQSGFDFLITQQGFLSRIGSFFGMQDVKVDDSAFDEAYVLKTNMQERFVQIFNEDIRRTLILRTAENNGYSLHLTHGILSYETIGEFESEAFNDEFAAMLDLAARIGNRIEGGTGELQQPISSALTAPPLMLTSAVNRLDTRKSIQKVSDDWPDDEEYLKRLARDLIGGRFEEEDDRCFYSIQYRRRSLLLEYFHRTNPRVLNISLSVIQKFWLRMLLQTGQDTADEIRVDDPLVDRSFLIHSDQREAARRFLNSISRNENLTWLSEFNRFEINKGRATVTIMDPKTHGFLRSALEQTLGNLLKLLESYEEQRLALSISQTKSSDHICPYCREDLDSATEQIVTCKLCHTSHHQSCLSENKQCTTWGCLASETDFA